MPETVFQVGQRSERCGEFSVVYFKPADYPHIETPYANETRLNSMIRRFYRMLGKGRCGRTEATGVGAFGIARYAIVRIS